MFSGHLLCAVALLKMLNESDWLRESSLALDMVPHFYNLSPWKAEAGLWASPSWLHSKFWLGIWKVSHEPCIATDSIGTFRSSLRIFQKQVTCEIKQLEREEKRKIVSCWEIEEAD